MEYTVQKLGRLAGVSTRTLRYYDEIGILKPARMSSSGYRIYGQEEVDRLQQILFYRELGVSLERIKQIMTSPSFDAAQALREHREQLLDKRKQLDTLISNVEKTIASHEGCSFCYARQFQSFIGMGAEDEFQNHILLKTNAAEALEAQLASMARRMGGRPENVGPSIGAVAIGTATDPYQPIEGKAGITRECLKVLAKYRVPTTITTRSPLILRDADLLAEMNLTSVNISINTTDAELTRKLEPATPPPARRLGTVRALAESGIRAGVFIAPMLPYLTDSEESLEALVASAQEHRAAFAMTSMLRLSSDVKPWFFHTLKTHFPQLVGPYAKLYRSAYADPEYIESRQRLARQLLVKYGLAADMPQAPKPTPAPTRPEPVQLAFEF